MISTDIDAKMQMYGKIANRVLLFAIAGIPHITEKAAGLYLISLFQIRGIRIQVCIIEVGSGLCPDTDSPSALFQPCLLYTSRCV